MGPAGPGPVSTLSERPQNSTVQLAVQQSRWGCCKVLFSDSADFRQPDEAPLSARLVHAESVKLYTALS
jgi:hypothetical protein